MVDWQSPETQALCTLLFTQMTTFVLGGFGWYLVRTWPIIEGNLVRRRLKLSYAHIPYLVSRYFHLTTVTLLVILFHVAMPVTSCGGLLTTRVNSVLGNIAGTAASTNLGVRAFMLWEGNRFVRGVMCLCYLIHVVLGIYVGATGISEEWSDNHTVCIIVSIGSNAKLLSFYVYTIVLDISVLCLTLAGIRRQHLPPNTPLSSILTFHGIGYAFVTCLTNIPMAVMLALNLNSIMNVFLSIPGCSVSIITSSAFVVSLLRLRDGNELGTCAALPKSFAPLSTNINISGYRSSLYMREEDKRTDVEHQNGTVAN